MKSEVWVDFKLPLLNEWYPESYWSGRGKKEILFHSSRGTQSLCYRWHFLKPFLDILISSI